VAYKFGNYEPVRAATARCAVEQLDQAIADLSEGITEDPVEAVHDARKSIKKERSLLRLARGAMTPEQRRAENAALREAAHGLSGSRDAAVMTTTLDQLSDRFVGQVPATTFDRIRDELRDGHDDDRAQIVGSALNERAVQELGAVRVRVDDWTVTEDGWKAVESGLMVGYKRGRKAFRRAHRGASDEDLHQWRKRVKDLWYHARLLAPICGPAIQGLAKDAHRLADLLGDDHDLALLRGQLGSSTISVPADIDAVVGLIDYRRGELQAEAVQIGGRVYAESPKAFRRRMRRSWDAGRGAAMVALESRPVELAQATREPSLT
jgi:CHAD domain-containing protein